jgi:hypothetical protein
LIPTTLRPLAAFGLVLALLTIVSACAGQPPPAASPGTGAAPPTPTVPATAEPAGQPAAAPTAAGATPQPPAAPTAVATEQAAPTAAPATVPVEQVQILEGTHTVRHSTAPLPSADNPREDGKPTLVWFSATW